MESSTEVLKQTSTAPEQTEKRKGPLLDKETWHEEADRAVEQGGPLSILIIDLNNFKEVNDSIGHDRGDEVLAEISAIISECLRLKVKPGYEGRDLDLLTKTEQREVSSLNIETDNELIDTKGGRIGGDEFGALVHASKEVAQMIASRIRTAIAEYNDRPENKDLKDVEFGASIGISTLEVDGTESSELLKVADDAMFEDKLSQLPELTEHKKQAIMAAITVLESNGIRRRDFAKYLRLDLLS